MSQPETPQEQKNEGLPELPPPGPVYVISETGFGPSGRFASEEEVDKQAKRWRLLNWFSERIRLE